MHLADLVSTLSLRPKIKKQRLITDLTTYFFFRLTDKLSRLKVSQMRSNLTFLSSGLSVPNEER